MPPAKRKAEGTAAAAASSAAAPMRVTRAAAKRAAASSDPPPVPVVKKAAKKAKVAAAAKKQKRNEKENEDVPVESENKAEEKEEGGDASEKNVLDASNKTIVVEHCKQCNSFKTRANLVKVGLEKADIGITVILNPEKPRKGCFEIRQEGGGKKFITLLDLKRPFKPMKDLDMDKVISDIIEEISKTS
ncbi:hypothetical protein AAZX31_14G121000 [Glycine max]|uniref:Selenoprotein H n=2 Tax=Glycine subgen. Soja TaxID=1462606 RepID=I1M9R2_SOYBN|nr:uncharacterized protein LOC100788694 [Glycine max]XP_028223256.1 selenoprotein H-like [Glycine soja]KAG4963020.1 hypothetical protein JHK86_039888 [Glycine max]KAG5110471.1 hypothetical protein JHK82_039694 [Glycine max]KAG5121759.1 hypothetical protein JHK84_040099 [Glycine max]KAH1094321.1 hypothetical protein GYH30_039848 [Glycine max]KAH1213058.1 hypothetical protein GmHk_14G041090 [Glycine max]|eukprot:NP_001242745.2 uncharacterized protein LOC100788694 [Glycine max]